MTEVAYQPQYRRIEQVLRERIAELGPGRRLPSDAELVADDIRERRLAEPGRSVEQHVIERFAALARGGNRDLKVRADALLADVVVQRAGTKPRLVLDIFIDPRRGDDPRGVCHSREIL